MLFSLFKALNATNNHAEISKIPPTGVIGPNILKFIDVKSLVDKR